MNLLVIGSILLVTHVATFVFGLLFGRKNTAKVEAGVAAYNKVVTDVQSDVKALKDDVKAIAAKVK